MNLNSTVVMVVLGRPLGLAALYLAKVGFTYPSPQQVCQNVLRANLEDTLALSRVI